MYRRCKISIYHILTMDRTEWNYFWPLLWLFVSPFPSLLIKEERRKGEGITKAVIKNAFLLDPNNAHIVWVMIKTRLIHHILAEYKNYHSICSLVFCILIHIHTYSYLFEYLRVNCLSTATTKIRNNYVTIQSFIFPILRQQYWTFLYCSL